MTTPRPAAPPLPRTEAPSPFRYRRHEDCPDVATHRPPPRNMNDNGCSPTHKQARCPTCGYWSLWIKREPKS